MVEFGIVVLFLMTIVTLIAQGGFLFSGWLAVTNGAREGARFAAPCLNRSVQGCTHADVEAVVRDRTAGFLDQTPGRFGVVVTSDVDVVTVTVTATVSSVSPVLGDLPVAARSEMRLETSPN